MSRSISAPSRAFRALLGLFAFALFAAVAVADPVHAAHAVPHVGALADTSLVDGFALHAVGVGSLAAAVAVPKGTMAKLKAAIKNLLGPEATDEQVDAALAAEIAESDTVATPPPTQVPPITTATPADLAAAIQAAVEAAVAPLKAEVTTLQGALQTEATARTAAQTAVETQRATERTASIETLLDAAVKDGRIVPAKRDEWKTRLEGGFDTVSPILAELAPNPALAKANGGKVSADTSGAKTGDKPAAERPAPGSMAGSVPSAALDYVTANTN
jgi:hypothetical protein